MNVSSLLVFLYVYVCAWKYIFIMLKEKNAGSVGGEEHRERTMKGI